MNRVDLRELAICHCKPSLTLLISCEHVRSKVDRRVEKLHEMFGAAMAQIKNQYNEHELAGFVQEPHLLESQIEIDDPTCESVAIFVNKTIARAYALPFDLPDTTIINNMFGCFEVQKVLNRIPRYWLLVIRNQVPYLFEGYESSVTEVVHRHTSWQGEETFEAQDLGGLVCDLPMQQWGSQCRYQNIEEFYAKLDAYLRHFLEVDKLPLVLLAGGEDIEQFKKHSVYNKHVLVSSEMVALLSQAQMAKMMWPSVKKYYDHQRTQHLHLMREACEAHMCLTNVADIWKALHEDRIRMLCVEEQLHQTACEDLAHAKVTVKPSCGSLRSIDIIDDILELAISKNISVSLHPQDGLSAYHGIVALIRE